MYTVYLTAIENETTSNYVNKITCVRAIQYKEILSSKTTINQMVRD